MFEQLEFHLKGLVPLIVHNGQMADPTNEIVMRIKDIEKQKKRGENLSPKLAEEKKKLQFLGSLYLNEKGKPVLPGEGIEAAFRSFARKRKKGKDSEYAIVCDDDPEIIYDGPKDPEKMFKEKRFVFTKLVGIQRSRVVATRCRFPEWELKFTLNYMPEVFAREQVIDLMEIGGKYVGMFDWRPKYGRFEVLSPRSKTNGN